MKRIAATALALALASCGDAPTGAPAAAARTERVAYAVEGMHCGGCAEAIVAEVGEVKGVRSVRCTYESKVAVIELDDGAVRPEAERAITKMGYRIAAVPAPAEPAQPPASK
jgi:copper chaperone CopZ